MLLSMISCLAMMTTAWEITMVAWTLPLCTALAVHSKSAQDGVVSVDWTAFLLIFITFWVFMLSMMSMDMSNKMVMTLTGMWCAILMSFLTPNHLIFYITFEFSFILMFMFLLSWGKNPERVQASLYMLFFTLSFSLPFLLMLVELSMVNNLTSFFSLKNASYKEIFWVFMILVFLVKLPIFSFHAWLPKAHVEAPVSGSMILAGVLLKLGGYGLIRFLPSITNLKMSNNFFYCLLVYLALLGGVVTSTLCTRHMDLKVVIAYSSVVHMSTVLLGLIINSEWSQGGAMLLMVAHGFVSSLLFFLMTSMYDLLSSRSMMMIKGAMAMSPSFSIVWFLGCALNLGVPPSMAFFSELMVFSAMGLVNMVDFFTVAILCFTTGVYCILMYVSVTHGLPVAKTTYPLSAKTTLLSINHLFFVCLYPMIFV